jgi:hypothetical protein
VQIEKHAQKLAVRNVETLNEPEGSIPETFKPLEDSNHDEEDCTGSIVRCHTVSCGFVCAGFDSRWAAAACGRSSR